MARVADEAMLKSIKSLPMRTADVARGVMIGISFVIMGPVWIAQGIRARWKIHKQFS
jgi:hypothetical protein